MGDATKTVKEEATLDGGDIQLFELDLDPIPAEGMVTVALKVRFRGNPSGTFFIAEVDADDQVPETNEMNNVTPVQIP